jgi:hypothetical protein
MDRYGMTTVEFEPDAKDADRSLGWLARELGDPGFTMIEDTEAVREWAGVVDGDKYARFAEGWDLGNKPDQPKLMQTEHGCLAGHRPTWDGIEWSCPDGPQSCR